MREQTKAGLPLTLCTMHSFFSSAAKWAISGILCHGCNSPFPVPLNNGCLLHEWLMVFLLLAKQSCQRRKGRNRLEP
jgi:hypothetical protein